MLDLLVGVEMEPVLAAFALDRLSHAGDERLEAVRPGARPDAAAVDRRRRCSPPQGSSLPSRPSVQRRIPSLGDAGLHPVVVEARVVEITERRFMSYIIHPCFC